MRIAIVNDLKLTMEALRQLILSQPGYDIAWVAFDGEEAITKCREDTPDLILLDLQMPKMDGVKATQEIMKQCPCPILIVTSSVSGNASRVFEALGFGALDAVSSPVFGTVGNLEGGDEVLRKIQIIARLTGHTRLRSAGNPSKGSKNSKIPIMVAIGSSTGGPNALVQIISRLPKNLNATVIVVQHVDAQFVGSLSEWISGETGWEVTLANSGQFPRAGKVFIAGTNDHLVIGPDHFFHYREEPAEYPYRPSIDEFFLSAKSNWPTKGVGVLLTGMGRDGARGLLALREAGWHTIAQDEATSVIFGMPKAAIELGAAKEVLALEEISAAICRKVDHGHS